MENVFNNGSMTMTFHILNVHDGLGGLAKDGRCKIYHIFHHPDTEKHIQTDRPKDSQIDI